MAGSLHIVQVRTSTLSFRNGTQAPWRLAVRSFVYGLVLLAVNEPPIIAPNRIRSRASLICFSWFSLSPYSSYLGPRLRAPRSTCCLRQVKHRHREKNGERVPINAVSVFLIATATGALFFVALLVDGCRCDGRNHLTFARPRCPVVLLMTNQWVESEC